MANRALLLGIAGGVGLVALWLLVSRGAPSPVLDRILANLPPDMVVTHGAVSFDPLRQRLNIDNVTVKYRDQLQISAPHLAIDGVSADSSARKIAHISADNVGYTSQALLQWPADGGTSKTVTANSAIKIAHIDIDSLDLGAIHTLATQPPGQPTTMVPVTILSHLGTSGILVSTDAPDAFRQTLSISQENINNLSITPFAPPAADDSLGWIKVLAANAKIDDETVDDMRIDFSDYHAQFSLLGNAGPFHMHHYDSGQIDKLSLDKMAFTGKVQAMPINFAWPHLIADHIDIRPLTEILPQLRNAATPSQNGQKLLVAMKLCTVGHSEMDGLHLDFGLPNGAHINAGIASNIFDTAVDQNSVRHSTGSMNEFTVSGTGLPDSVNSMIGTLGVTSVTMDGKAASSYDPKNGRYDMEHLDYTLRDLAQLHVSGSYDQLPTISDPLSQMKNTMVNHFKFVYQDHSLTSKIMTLIAAKDHTTAAEETESIVTKLQAMQLAAVTQPDPRMPAILGQLQKFIQSPGQLTIAFNPPSPLSLADLSSVPKSELLTRLGLSVTAAPLPDQAATP